MSKKMKKKILSACNNWPHHNSVWWLFDSLVTLTKFLQLLGILFRTSIDSSVRNFVGSVLRWRRQIHSREVNLRTVELNQRKHCVQSKWNLLIKWSSRRLFIYNSFTLLALFFNHRSMANQFNFFFVISYGHLGRRDTLFWLCLFSREL